MFRVDYTLPSKQRADKIVGVKALVSAVMNAEASSQMFVRVSQAGPIGPH